MEQEQQKKELEVGNIGDLLNLSPEEDRAVGIILGGIVGDVLGSAVEGSPYIMIKMRGGVRNYMPGKHMGMGRAGFRYGMYTDDTNSTLALASSLVEKGGLVPLHVAHNYGRYWLSKPPRGYPESAKAVMHAVLEGTDIKTTGTLCFKDGSFANGGAMRISPIGIVFRNATDEELYEAVRMAIISSHVHPEAIDGAWLQAKAITILSKLEKPESMTKEKFLELMKELAKTEAMKNQIDIVIKCISDNVQIPEVIPLLGDEFQIKTVDAMGSVFWVFATYWNEPEECLIKAVELGGDTDTVAAIAGALCGALHGSKWIPLRWYNRTENGEKGRDYAVQISKDLSKLDLNGIKTISQEEEEQILEESKRLLKTVNIQ